MRTVFFVFKTILFMIISLTVIDLVVTLTSLFTLNDELDATAKMMQQNIMEENYITDDARDVYEAILNGNSTTYPDYDGISKMDADTGARRVGASGLSGDGILATEIDFRVEDSTGTEVTEPQPYGTFLKLTLNLDVIPSLVDISMEEGDMSVDNINRAWYVVNIEKEYVVPCLRYVK